MNELSLFPPGILEPESETVEYKESFHEECLKDLAAFSNTRGGTLRVGIRDDGTVSGWSGSGKDQEAIVSRIADTLGVHPLETIIDPFAGAGAVLAITMPQTAFPVAVRGRYYRRVGNSTREVTDAERVRFLLERTGQSWDALPCDASLPELAPRMLADFRVLSRERLPELSPQDTDEALLDKLSLRLTDGSLKRGAYLLFGSAPYSRFHNAEVQVGRFADGTTILDDQLVRGNLFDQLNGTISALRKHLLVRYEFQNHTTAGGSILEDLQRKEVWEIPLVALREAILNALIHRDYTVSTSIQIRIFDDRVMIDNPGGLLGNMTVEDLLIQPHPSLRRNPLLAETIYFTKLIERWGSGTIRIGDACRAQGVLEPEFSATPHGFRVTFWRPSRIQEVRSDLSPDERSLLEFAYHLDSVSAADCAAEFGMSTRRAGYLLLQLANRGFLSSSGERRWRRYSLNRGE